jgi:pilus assembly protein CpaE
VYGQASSKEILPQAMAAGAQRYLTYPFTATALHEAIITVHESLKQLVASAHPIIPEGAAGAPAAEPKKDGQVIAFFSPKGGVGTTTLAVNLACALARLGRRVALVDANISFGNVSVLLDLVNASTMLALAGDPERIREDSVDDLLVPHDSGVRVLLAPAKPDEAERIEDEHLRRIVTALRLRYEYVVVDTWASYDARVLAVLECADRVLVPTTPDLQAVKNLTAFLRVADLLHLSDKLSLVMMRVDSVNDAYLRHIQEFLDRPITWNVVSDGKRVIKSVVAGTPFVLKEPTARISRDVQRIARDMDGQAAVKPVPKRPTPWRPARLRFKPAP